MARIALGVVVCAAVGVMGRSASGALMVFGTGTSASGVAETYRLSLNVLDPATRTLDLSVDSVMPLTVPGRGTIDVLPTVDLGATFVAGRFFGSIDEPGVPVMTAQIRSRTGEVVALNETAGSSGLGGNANGFVPGAWTVSGEDFAGPMVVGFSDLHESGPGAQFAFDARDVSETVLAPTTALGSESEVGGMAFDSATGRAFSVTRLNQAQVRLTVAVPTPDGDVESVNLLLLSNSTVFGALGLTYLEEEGLLLGSTTLSTGTRFFVVDPALASQSGSVFAGSEGFYVSDELAEGVFISGLGAVPSPGTVGLLGAAGVLAVGRRRQR